MIRWGAVNLAPQVVYDLLHQDEEWVDPLGNILRLEDEDDFSICELATWLLAWGPNIVQHLAHEAMTIRYQGVLCYFDEEQLEQFFFMTPLWGRVNKLRSDIVLRQIREARSGRGY